MWARDDLRLKTWLLCIFFGFGLIACKKKIPKIKRSPQGSSDLEAQSQFAKNTKILRSLLGSQILELAPEPYGEHVRLKMVVVNNAYRDHYEFYICSQDGLDCLPPAEAPQEFFDTTHYFDLAPAGLLQVFIRTCVRPRIAEDPQNPCGDWAKGEVDMPPSGDPELARLLSERDELRRQNDALCRDYENHLAELKDHQQSKLEPEQITQIESLIEAGDLTCAMVQAGDLDQRVAQSQATSAVSPDGSPPEDRDEAMLIAGASLIAVGAGVTGYSAYRFVMQEKELRAQQLAEADAELQKNPLTATPPTHEQSVKRLNDIRAQQGLPAVEPTEQPAARACGLRLQLTAGGCEGRSSQADQGYEGFKKRLKTLMGYSSARESKHIVFYGKLKDNFEQRESALEDIISILSKDADQAAQLKADLYKTDGLPNLILKSYHQLLIHGEDGGWDQIYKNLSERYPDQLKKASEIGDDVYKLEGHFEAVSKADDILGIKNLLDFFREGIVRQDISFLYFDNNELRNHLDDLKYLKRAFSESEKQNILDYLNPDPKEVSHIAIQTEPVKRVAQGTQAGSWQETSVSGYPESGEYRQFGPDAEEIPRQSTPTYEERNYSVEDLREDFFERFSHLEEVASKNQALDKETKTQFQQIIEEALDQRSIGIDSLQEEILQKMQALQEQVIQLQQRPVSPHPEQAVYDVQAIKEVTDVVQQMKKEVMQSYQRQLSILRNDLARLEAQNKALISSSAQSVSGSAAQADALQSELQQVRDELNALKQQQQQSIAAIERNAQNGLERIEAQIAEQRDSSLTSADHKDALQKLQSYLEASNQSMLQDVKDQQKELRAQRQIELADLQASLKKGLGELNSLKSQLTQVQTSGATSEEVSRLQGIVQTAEQQRAADIKDLKATQQRILDDFKGLGDQAVQALKTIQAIDGKIAKGGLSASQVQALTMQMRRLSDDISDIQADREATKQIAAGLEGLADAEERFKQLVAQQVGLQDKLTQITADRERVNAQLRQSHSAHAQEKAQLQSRIHELEQRLAAEVAKQPDCPNCSEETDKLKRELQAYKDKLLASEQRQQEQQYEHKKRIAEGRGATRSVSRGSRYASALGVPVGMTMMAAGGAILGTELKASQETYDQSHSTAAYGGMQLTSTPPKDHSDAATLRIIANIGDKALKMIAIGEKIDQLEIQIAGRVQ